MHLPNGSKIFIESSRESDNRIVRADTSPPAANVAQNSFTVIFRNSGDSLAYRSGDTVMITESDRYGFLTGKVYRVLSVGGGRVRLWPEDRRNEMEIGTSITFPGACRRITSWAELPCIQSIDKEGNEQNWYTYQCLNSGREERQKTTKSALFMSYTMAHDPGNPAYAVMKEKEKNKLLMAMRMHIPRAKENRYWSGGVSFDDIPNTAVNEMETVTLRMAIRGAYNFLPSS
ncbi:tail protein depolymerase [Klebsiella phage vB_KpnS-VAC2]|uniref:Tail protein depolymerase n=1 Tax=Klebsiella phage vB_KpnS-VAC2 TaxID=2864369 RepID=A0AAE7XHF5_9CAUD|nr:tail protein depolymerase [Klebsiella phage vB_KpnS-VAC2]